MYKVTTYEDANLALQLLKSIYGLKQAGRDWNNDLDTFIRSLGYARCYSDVCVYYKGDRNNKCILIIYVDDIIIMTKRREHILEVQRLFKEHYKLRTDTLHHYLGLHITTDQTRCKITLSLEQYIHKLVRKFHQFPADSSVRTPIVDRLCESAEEDVRVDKTLYRSAVCSIMYAVHILRLDANYAANMEARFMQDPNETHMKSLIRTVQYLGNTATKKIVYTKEQDTANDYQFSFYADSSHQDEKRDKEGRCRSTGGYIGMMSNGPITWRVRRSKRATGSPMNSEFIALADATKTIKGLRNLMLEIGFEQNGPTKIYEDCSSAISAAENPRVHEGLRGADIQDIRIVRDAVQYGEIELVKVDTNQNYADMMTKPMTTHKQQQFASHYLHD